MADVPSTDLRNGITYMTPVYVSKKKHDGAWKYPVHAAFSLTPSLTFILND